MKLTAFGETIRRIEAERLEEARAAVANGWTKADHPTKCCPPATPQPKRAGRPLDEVKRLHTRAANKAKWWADAVIRKQSALDAREAARPKFDHGMLNLPLKQRMRAEDAGQRMWRELEAAKGRAAHFSGLERKYAEQIERRSQ